MKKALSLFIAFSLVLTIHAQDTVKKAITDTAAVTWTRVYNDVTGVLSGLGSALKVGTEHVYGVLVRQQLVNSITGCFFIIATIISLFGFRRFINWAKSSKKYSDPHYDGDEIGWIILTIVFGVFVLILFTVCVTNLQQTVTGFVNPEYGAMKEIMDKIK